MPNQRKQNNIGIRFLYNYDSKINVLGNRY